MWELYYGGWIAPNIYYLGNTGCVRVDGLRIMGMSWIFKSGDYHKGKLSDSIRLDEADVQDIMKRCHWTDRQ
jgi:hypothetical protein